MKLKIFFGVVTAIIVTVGFFVIKNINQENKMVVTTGVSTVETVDDKKDSLPWIEIITPSIFESDADGNVLREFKNGDEAQIGNAIEVKNGGLANIYFPDGSVVRVNSGTKLVIEDASFDSQSGKMSVKVYLMFGKIWNKVLGLATPDSLWEVKTSNAVATVRGTAFGVEVANGKSTILGSENKIEVAPVDKSTGKILNEAKVEITSNKLVEVKDDDVKAIVASISASIAVTTGGAATTGGGAATTEQVPAVMRLAIQEASKEALSQSWVKANIKEDVEFNVNVAEIKKAGLEEKDVRAVMRETIQEFKKEIQKEGIQKESFFKPGEIQTNIFEIKLQEIIQEKTQNIEQKETNIEIQPSIKEPISTDTTKETVDKQILPPTNTNPLLTKPEPINISGSISGARGLQIASSRGFQGIIEGEIIEFKALLIKSDGTAENVTQSVSWQVLGPIGAIIKPGFFKPELSPEIAEAGEASGSVVAIWKDAKTGDALIGKTPIFKVDAKVDVLTPDQMRG